MEREKYAIITAAGSGVRMGSPVPKQFLPLKGKPILLRTIEKFIEAEPDINIILTLPASHVPTWAGLCRDCKFIHPQRIVHGGPTRFHSIKNALEHVPEGALVAIHDGVRPLVDTSLIRTLFNLAMDSPAVCPVMPITETVKCLRADGDAFVSIDGMTADRSILFGAQTPQVFQSEAIIRAYDAQPFNPSFTDDASVAEGMKIPVRYVPGGKFNIKITTPEDLVLAEALIDSCN
ncbi:MAG: 2-C-methyl-D-erythritol 4-phosphate cytidylyltransferase [Bacteroidales bacterium]|nr:2-C-methyl-D-erythritol 4-phosphate cytidylyltransferase [Bacteroidales bacterium]